MTFSVQNNNPTYLVEFLPAMMTIKVLESVSGIFLFAQKDVQIQVGHMHEIMRGEFSEHHQVEVPIIENQLERWEDVNDVADCKTSRNG